MSKQTYRMKILDIICWILYTIFFNLLYASIILLVANMYFVVFDLNRTLNISHTAIFRTYPFLLIILLLIYVPRRIASKIIYVAFDDSKLALRSLYKRYEFNWSEIKSIDETVKTQRFISFSPYHGGIWYLMPRRNLVIKTESNTFVVELSGHIFDLYTTGLATNLEKFWKGEGK